MVYKQTMLSIIIPVYNVEKYLETSINSLVSQVSSNVEVILIDDGSTDRSGEICEQFAQNYSQIEVIHQENQGLSGARNTGIEIAKGKWLAFLDSDDYLAANYCKILVEVLEKYDPDVFIFQYKKFKDEQVVENDNLDCKVAKISKIDAFKTLSDENYGCYTWNKVYKRKLFRDIRFPIGKNFEDMATTYQLFGVADNIYISSEKIYYYRQRKNSIVYTPSFKNRQDRIEALIEMFKYLEKNYPTYKFDIQRSTIMEGIHYLWIGKNNNEVNENIVKELKKILTRYTPDRKWLGKRLYFELKIYQTSPKYFNYLGNIEKTLKVITLRKDK